MNETLYSWTFKFYKVVRQQNSGVVEDFILSYSAVYLRIQKWKNYWNRSTFAKVTVKIKVAQFFLTHSVVPSVSINKHCLTITSYLLPDSIPLDYQADSFKFQLIINQKIASRSFWYQNGYVPHGIPNVTSRENQGGNRFLWKMAIKTV